jgi:HAD superfamily hydrolase (TIGR01509 family)
MTEMPQAVIFDMDGVIIDSEPLHEKAQQIVFARHGLDVPVRAYSEFKGQTEDVVFDLVVRQWGNGSHDPGVLAAEKHTIYASLIEEMKLMDGSLDFIRFLTDRGYPLALTTSATRVSQERVFDRFGLTSYFDIVVTAEDVRRSKPDPEPYVVTASRMNRDPAQCLVIEDSLNGVRSARGAGCLVAAITTSFAADDLRSAGAHMVHETFAELRTEFSRS